MSDKPRKPPPGGRGSIDLKVSAEQTGGAMSVHLQTLPPGAATFTHIHHNCEETVYPVIGNPTVTVDGNAAVLRAGESAVVPRGCPHAISNESDGEIQFLFITTPGGIEGFFQKSAQDKNPDPAAEAERIKALAMEHGVELVTPPAS